MQFLTALTWGLGTLCIAPAWGQPLTVVELYQSQGCSSCPPAISNINALVNDPRVLALTFAVTYWDRLGWKDTFARPEFTSRQYDYQRGLHGTNVYTPQVIVDGRSAIVGVDKSELASVVRNATPLSGPQVSVAGDLVEVASHKMKLNADVWLVRFDPRILQVAIGAGENAGVTIAHRNVVRSLTHLGTWSGQRRAFALPVHDENGWKSAVLIQVEHGGPVISALVL
ncbi:MAG TPA: DUF1223 domain-containing protein [Rhizomicrobium sp.]|nr:DUF1223 domain-containing protein [Rhizomicrobium sp.]